MLLHVWEVIGHCCQQQCQRFGEQLHVVMNAWAAWIICKSSRCQWIWMDLGLDGFWRFRSSSQDFASCIWLQHTSCWLHLMHNFRLFIRAGALWSLMSHCLPDSRLSIAWWLLDFFATCTSCSQDCLQSLPHCCFRDSLVATCKITEQVGYVDGGVTGATIETPVICYFVICHPWKNLSFEKDKGVCFSVSNSWGHGHRALQANAFGLRIHLPLDAAALLHVAQFATGPALWHSWFGEYPSSASVLRGAERCGGMTCEHRYRNTLKDMNT